MSDNEYEELAELFKNFATLSERDKRAELTGFDLNLTGFDCAHEVEYGEPWSCPFIPGCSAGEPSKCPLATQFAQIQRAPKRSQ
jgi:hypothetical protein